MKTEILSDQVRVDLIDIEPTEVPEAVVEMLGWKSSLYVDSDDLRINQFNELYASFHDNGVTSYIASQVKTYEHLDQSEKIYHVVDADNEGTVIGYSELRYALTDDDPYFLGKPFVGNISTEKEFRRTRKGNLSGRLAVLSTISREKLGFPLYSDTLLSKEAARVVARLVKMGYLEEVQEGDLTRYKSVQ